MTKEKDIVGLIEKVKIVGTKGSVEALAKFDTGATNNSIDYKIAAEAGVGPVIASGRIRSVSAGKGYRRRPIVAMELEVKGKRFNTRANLENREKMKYKVLIGREIILNNFIVDVAKTHKSKDEDGLKKEVKEIISGTE